jgi:hypothetical protein
MRPWVLACLVLICLCGTARAGPWMRETGRTFTSATFTLNQFRETTSQSYFEHGLRDDLTWGLDIGYITDRFGTQSGYGTLFLRRPLNDPRARSLWAYEVGAGVAWVGPRVLPHLKGGLSWGRGIELGARQGWLSVDASAAWQIDSGAYVAKVNTTFGLDFTERTTGMVQLFLADVNGIHTATLAPAIVFRAGDSKFRVQVGTESPLGNVRNTSLKIGLWREF